MTRPPIIADEAIIGGLCCWLSDQNLMLCKTIGVGH